MGPAHHTTKKISRTVLLVVVTTFYLFSLRLEKEQGKDTSSTPLGIYFISNSMDPPQQQEEAITPAPPAVRPPSEVGGSNNMKKDGQKFGSANYYSDGELEFLFWLIYVVSIAPEHWETVLVCQHAKAWPFCRINNSVKNKSN